MKQAIQEGFILDVLKHYTPVKSYYKLAKTVEGDPEFDVKKARKKLRRYVEGHEHAIRLKAEIIVDHYHEQVVAQHKIDGKARAMVVTNGIEARHPVLPRHSRLPEVSARAPTRPSLPSRGKRNSAGEKVTEATLNGFRSANKIAEKIPGGPLPLPRLCADKFQTGYDEPLLHTMYVDKTSFRDKGGPDPVSPQPGAPEKARRLRARFPQRHGHHHRGLLELLPHHHPVRRDRPQQTPRSSRPTWTAPRSTRPTKSSEFVKRYLDGVDRDRLDPILDQCVAVYMSMN